MHRDDQLFLDDASSHMHEEQTELLAKVRVFMVPQLNSVVRKTRATEVQNITGSGLILVMNLVRERSLFQRCPPCFQSINRIVQRFSLKFNIKSIVVGNLRNLLNNRIFRIRNSHRHQMPISFKHGCTIEIFPGTRLEITLHHHFGLQTHVEGVGTGLTVRG